MPVSDRTITLLAGGEGIEIEYKTKVRQDFNDILVAFANGVGGVVLFGVEDDEDATGKHIGRIVGIEIYDRTRGQIQSRADETFDKIIINIETETDDEGRGIYIVTVPEGKNKPYCTGGGRYLVRRDGQNCPVTPTMMEEYIAPRIQKAPSAKKQLLLKEMEVLKDILEEGLTDARRDYPPYYTQEVYGMVRSDRIDDIVANLTIDDSGIIEASREFIETANAYAKLWFEAGRRLKSSFSYEPSKEQRLEELGKMGGEEYKIRLEELYKFIAKRIYELLS